MSTSVTKRVRGPLENQQEIQRNKKDFVKQIMSCSIFQNGWQGVCDWGRSKRALGALLVCQAQERGQGENYEKPNFSPRAFALMNFSLYLSLYQLLCISLYISPYAFPTVFVFFLLALMYFYQYLSLHLSC